MTAIEAGPYRWEDAPDWLDDAACATAVRDPDHPAAPGWWDVTSGHPTVDQHRDALQVCDRCPVTDECLDAADPRHDRYSIRGGMLPADWRRAQREETHMNELLPDGDPPTVAPYWRPLLTDPCTVCHGRRLFVEGAVQGPQATGKIRPATEGDRDVPGARRANVTVLCGDCGHVDTRHGVTADVDDLP